jgi:hypothetical protein
VGRRRTAATAATVPTHRRSCQNTVALPPADASPRLGIISELGRALRRGGTWRRDLGQERRLDHAISPAGAWRRHDRTARRRLR